MDRTNNNIMEQLLQLSTFIHHYQRYHFINSDAGKDTHLRVQRRVLSILEIKPEISQKDLVFLLDMCSPSVEERLTELEEIGYITRIPSEGDPKINIVQLTPEGKKATEKAVEKPQDIHTLLDCLGKEEQLQFKGFLERISEELKKQLAKDGIDQHHLTLPHSHMPDGLPHRERHFGKGPIRNYH